MNILIALTGDLPVGTDLALLQFIWMLVSGALLPERGALFPALQATGLAARGNPARLGSFPERRMANGCPSAVVASPDRRFTRLAGTLP